jgi:putative membrane protein
VGAAGPAAIPRIGWGFTAHMTGHLLLGMVGPLLMVLAAPVTLVLGALPVAGARAFGRFLRTPWVRVVTHPVVAGVLNAGGLWLLYTTDLFSLTHSSALVHGLVHTHVFLTGVPACGQREGEAPRRWCLTPLVGRRLLRRR